MDKKIIFNELCSALNFTALCGDAKSELAFTDATPLFAGLSLSGFETDFTGRAAFFGREEEKFIFTLDKAEADERLKKVLCAELIVLTRESLKELVLPLAEQVGARVVFCQHSATAAARLSVYIEEMLTDAQIIHAVLVDLYGVGMLILGKSGIGKSETALELLDRGHLLVADDAVVVRRFGQMLIGKAPPITRHFMEIRGIGIIDVQAMYGAGAVKLEQEIDMAVRLEPYVEGKDYTAEEKLEILGVSLPLITLPVSQGRNISVLLEVAARNLRLKAIGIDAMQELNRRIAVDKNR